MDGCSYDKWLRSQLFGGVGLVVRFQVTNRMLEGECEYFNYLGNVITNDAKVHVKLNPGLPWQKLILTIALLSPANWT